MTDRAYVEFASSDLFLSHFFGPSPIPAFDPDVYAIASLRIALRYGVTVEDNDAASGTAYQGIEIINGERCYIFLLKDGVDTHRASIRESCIDAPTMTLTAL